MKFRLFCPNVWLRKALLNWRSPRLRSHTRLLSTGINSRTRNLHYGQSSHRSLALLEGRADYCIERSKFGIHDAMQLAPKQAPISLNYQAQRGVFSTRSRIITLRSPGISHRSKVYGQPIRTTSCAAWDLVHASAGASDIHCIRTFVYLKFITPAMHTCFEKLQGAPVLAGQ